MTGHRRSPLERAVQVGRYLRKAGQRRWLQVERRLARPYLVLRGGRDRIRTANVAMFHLGRSGSTMLADLLRQHPHVHWDGEIYNHHFRRLARVEGPLRIGETETGLDPVGCFEQCMHHSLRRVYGFELKFCHLELAGTDLADYLKRVTERGVTHFIVLERRNYLRKIVSAVIARQTRQYHLRTWKEPTLNRVRIDVEDLAIDFDRRPLLSYLEGYRDNFARLDDLLADRRVLNLTYEEDLAPGPQESYRRICAFLGLTPRRPAIRYARLNPYSLSELILNFEEVAAALAGTPFTWMLDDGESGVGAT